MKDFFFEQRGIFFRKNEFKDGRPAIVFVHGISGSSSAWIPYEEKFESVCNILSFDLRGHGKSKRYGKWDDYNISDFSMDFKKLLDFLGIKKYNLVSHSFGALVAFDFLADNMGMVEKAIFISPNACPSKLWEAKVLKPITKINRLLDKLGFHKKEGTHLDYVKYLGGGDWNLKRMFADIRNTGLRIFLYATEKAYEVDYEPLLPRIDFPVLLVHGRRDSIFPLEGSLFIQKNIKKSRLEIIENADHILVVNHFEKVSAAIKDFIGLPSS